jgi:membrane peptidoglycan carboxypeptidase
VNDHRDQRHRSSEPAWPTEHDPDAAGWPKHEEPVERTGFWSPLWDDDDDQQAPAHTGRRAAAGGRGNGHANGNGHARPTQRVAPPAGPTTRMPRPPAGQPPPLAGPTVALRRDPSQDPTEVLAPVGGGGRREPDLLTHREGEYVEDEEFLDDEDAPPSEDDRKRRRKKIWRRIRRTMYVFIILMIIGPVLAFFIAYNMVDVPDPRGVAFGHNQPVTLKYADGSEMTKIVPEGANRTFVPYNEIPKQMLNAAFAAEDDTFMTNSGFDLTGVARAGWNQVTGGTGGGSTITQQYIKQATGQDEKTLTRKALEVVKAYKMNRTFSKEDIITAYLNTIYLGRNSYGVAAAAKSYFNKDLKAITPSEAALLAGMIQGPGRYKDTAYMEKRWNYVMDRLVANNWFPSAQRQAEKFPTPVPYEQTRNKALTGPRGLIQDAVFDELANGPLKMNQDQVQRGGYTIVTTIDPKAQQLAEDSVHEVMNGQPTNLHPGLVAVDPKTGEVKAYYGGEDGKGTDWAATRQEPGSSFKPFDLVALLEKGKGLGEVYDGTSPRTFDGQPRRNSDNAQCPNCTVAEAMKRSINTVFFEIGVNVVQTQKVADAAHQSGITSPLVGPNGGPPTDGIAIGGDSTRVSTEEMASAYGTFAAGGIYRTPHMVAKVLNKDGSTYWSAQPDDKQAFDRDPKLNQQIARNVTESLLPVPKWSNIPCADNRVCAGKTGTHQLGETPDNAKAWMVGYTPQLSTAVSMSGDKDQLAIKNSAKKIIYGSGLPGQIWKKFMDSYHKTFNLPKEDFGRYDPIGKEGSEYTSSSKKPTSNTDQPSTNNDETTTTQPSKTTTTTTTTKRSHTGPPTPTLPPVGGGGGGPEPAANDPNSGG